MVMVPLHHPAAGWGVPAPPFHQNLVSPELSVFVSLACEGISRSLDLLFSQLMVWLSVFA